MELQRIHFSHVNPIEAKTSSPATSIPTPFFSLFSEGRFQPLPETKDITWLVELRRLLTPTAAPV